MKEEKAKADILICEKKLSDLREIQISNEVRYKEIKEKIMRLENKLPRLFAQAALKEIPISQADKAKQELNKLEDQLKEIAILLKGLKLEEPHYIERISQANRILGSAL
jgi:predicted  nucleic acid-binding Zn-ribbon protein